MRHLLLSVFTCLALLFGGVTAVQAQGVPQRIDLWSRLTILSDPTHQLSWQEAADRAQTFTKPTGPYGNLGPRADTVWLHIPLQAPREPGPWWLVIDYAPLDVAEVHLLANGRRIQHQLAGDQLLVSERPAPTAMPAMQLAIEPGQHYDLLVRVRNNAANATIVPIALLNTAALLQHQSLVELLQGLALGFGLCMVCFTAARALVTREPMYAWFALACVFTTLFFLAYFGVAPLHLWPGNLWLTQNAPPLMLLGVLAFGCLFLVRSLYIAQHSRWVARAMEGVAALALIAAILFIVGVFDYRQASKTSTALGLLPMLLALPIAYKRARAGDRAARWAFVGWGVYTVGVVCLTALSLGHLPAEPGVQAIYQVCTVLETVAWMVVLSVRADELRLAAEHANREHARVLQMSQTDPLTGMLNRRGLQLGLPPLMLAANPDSLTAVYLLDLDGFKPVNDTYGHDAGDELLTEMGARLKRAVRAGDLVARLGGDEFVVVASQLRGEAEAERVGQKLLACSASPFNLSHATCRVGMTVGYAIAPFDGHDGDALLRRADAAMYGGKQAGKNRVRRAGEAALAVA